LRGGNGAQFVLDEADREEEIDVLSRLEFVVGLFHFCVSLVPPGLLGIVEAVGFQADREMGIRELRSAANRRGIHFITGSMILVAYHNFFMQQDEPTEELLKSIFTVGYEHSPAIRLIAGTCARRQGNIARAIDCYQQGILGVKNQPQVVLILEAELGNTYFMNGEWSKAADLFERFVVNTTNRQYKCFLQWKLGLCLWMMGGEDRVERVSACNQIVIETADDRFPNEKFSARVAKRFLAKKRYTKFEEIWFHAWSYNQARRFKDSMDVLNKAVDLVKEQSTLGASATELPQSMVECVSLCLYLKMSNYNGLEQLNEATEALQKLTKVQNEVVEELWVVPSAFVEMGELYLKLATKGIDSDNMYKKARVCLERATQFSDYDFERPLSFRIARGKDLLRNVPT
jgi:tetratricopeptide (TPR) repeat protein